MTIKLTAEAEHIEWTVGDAVEVSFTFVDDDGDPFDISAATIDALLLRDTTTVQTFATVVSGDGDNILTVSLTDTQTTSVGTESGLTYSVGLTFGGDPKQYVNGFAIGYQAGHPRVGRGVSSKTFTVGAATVTMSSVAPAAALAASPAFTAQFAPLAVDPRTPGLPTFTMSTAAILTQANSGLGTILWANVIRVDELLDDPLGRYYLYFSTDHDSGDGGIGLAYADDMEGPWTAHEDNPIFVDDATAGTQTETPSVAWNETNGELTMFYQQSAAGGVADQATKLATSADGVTWVVDGIVLDLPNTSWPGSSDPGGGHTGYFRPFRFGGMWVGYGLIAGGDYARFGQWLSDDGLTWVLDPRVLSNAGETITDATRRWAWNAMSLVEIKGRTFALGTTQPYVSGGVDSEGPWLMAPLAPDGRSLLGTPIDVTPAEAAWESGVRNGPDCAIVDHRGRLCVVSRSNGSTGGFGVAVASWG